VTTGPVLLLSAADVRRALPMIEAVEAMKQAFAWLSSGQAGLPLRSHVEAPDGQGRLLLMPCALPAAGALGLKAVSVFDRNPDRGLPRISALVVLFDAETGRARAILEGGALTALRTGAASGAATDLMARPDATRAAIIGAGVQARTQLEGVCAVRTVREARVYDVRTDAAAAFARTMSEELGLPVRAAATAAEAVRDADIVCAATPATSPVFADADLSAGVHINAVGAYLPEMQEVPVETVLRARVVVDHRESALEEAGDLLIPLRLGLWDASRIAAELGEVVTGKAPGRTSASEVTFFKSVGVAVQDLAAAVRIVANAGRLGLGCPAPF